ncbi:hypothetical protein BT96DRAFT_1002732 [Gymnopus androsaceus JB14]|uniref:Uncharacterized protein n=1 Tax=Gymnopus androsaceus JB14 TaxID=1447944 RepID=A0A6A4GWZ4_9AGAR|nr:hypothetical protein BT96DRAFT_1002732 [Gymnopus androsaceus JB14]
MFNEAYHVTGRTTLHLPRDLGFADFYSRVCVCMDLDPQSARIGYKLSGDRVRDAPNQLSNAVDYQFAVNKVLEKVRHAHSREVVLVLFNLGPATHAAEGSVRGKKRTHNKVNAADTNLSFNKELHELREHLECQKHHGCHCYIDPITSEHNEVDIPNQTLWAKKIFLGKTTIKRPLNSKVFDPKAKKAWITSSTTAALAAPPIHLHLNGIQLLNATAATTQSSTPPSCVHSPLHNSSSVINQPVETLNLTEDSDDDNVIYPLTGDLLAELDSLFPDAGYLQYEDVLVSTGVAHVNAFATVAPHFFT